MAKISNSELARVLAGYMECALWSSMDESDEDGGDPMDASYSIGDIDGDARAEMEKDCRDFIEGIPMASLEAYLYRYGYEHFGHDFWLTRNGHGVGFWDRGLGELGDWLTEQCKPYGDVNLYVGDDGRIYQ